jgi:Copper chaperone
MKTLKFKTNIKCGGCIATVTPFLNGVEGISKWDVDTSNIDKILTIELEGESEKEVVEKVKAAGFKIESLNQ